MITLYTLKPRFQALLRPLVAKLAGAGVTANQITLAASFGSCFLGILLIALPNHRVLFLALPLWLAARMALNAIDGMLAREHGQKSRLGGYLNELGDVVSDTALLLPFVFLPPFGALTTIIVIVLAAASEHAGAMGPLVGASRRYDGPMGKSDRALVTGALGLWIGLGVPVPALFGWVMPVVALLLLLTIANRIRGGLREP